MSGDRRPSTSSALKPNYSLSGGDNSVFALEGRAQQITLGIEPRAPKRFPLMAPSKASDNADSGGGEGDSSRKLRIWN